LERIRLSMIVEILKQQHRDALRIAQRIEDTFVSGTIDNPYALRSLLSLFIGKLTVHLDMRRTLQNNKHHQEMNAFSEEIKTYKKRWSAASSISEEQQNFIEDTRRIFSNLKRITESQERNMCAYAN